MTERSHESRAVRLQRTLTLGVAVPAGWALHDLAVFLVSGEPAIVWSLLPGWLAFLGAGALLAGLLSLSPRLGTAAVLLVALLPLPSDWALSGAQRELPRVIAVLLGTGVLATWLTGKRGGQALRIGLALGLIACVAWASARQSLEGSWASWLALGAAVVGLGLAALRATAARRLATLVVLCGCATPIGLRAWSDTKLARPDRADAGGSVEARPNLILVVLDTVRADRLASYGYARSTMPELERFMSERGLRYEQARASSSWTLPSHASLLTGLLPGQHGATHPRSSGAAIVGVGAWEALPLRGDVPTLAERLAQSGYRTGAIVANAYYLNHAYGLDRGFHHYDDRYGAWVKRYLALPQYAGLAVRAGQLLYRDARRITDLALEWIDERPAARPFFLFLNYMDAHAPYLPPGAFQHAFSSARPVDPLDLSDAEAQLEYDRELAFLDSELGRLLGGVEQRGALEDSVVIVTSDHGEALGDHGFRKHGWTLYDAVLRVPLFLKPAAGPHRAPPTNEPIGGAEVHDLALRELGLSQLVAGTTDVVSSEWFRVPDLSRATELAGRDLERDLVSWLEPPLKFIVTSHGKVEAFDLSVDPGERAPIELDAERTERALLRAETWWRDNPPPAASETESLPDVSERLEALGYFGDE